tara:strand:+ start:480 stop:776 length:297 start_codon:yes stop_codon:yes gene_type:complete
MTITRFDAICSLVGGELAGDEEGKNVKYIDGQTPPSEKAITDEIARLEKEESDNEYKNKRAVAYPPIGDQLDDLYHKGAFSDEMKAKLKKVKDDNPKG